MSYIIACKTANYGKTVLYLMVETKYANSKDNTFYYEWCSKKDMKNQEIEYVQFKNKFDAIRIVKNEVENDKKEGVMYRYKIIKVKDK